MLGRGGRGCCDARVEARPGAERRWGSRWVPGCACLPIRGGLACRMFRACWMWWAAGEGCRCRAAASAVRGGVEGSGAVAWRLSCSVDPPCGRHRCVPDSPEVGGGRRCADGCCCRGCRAGRPTGRESRPRRVTIVGVVRPAPGACSGCSPAGSQGQGHGGRLLTGQRPVHTVPIKHCRRSGPTGKHPDLDRHMRSTHPSRTPPGPVPETAAPGTTRVDRDPNKAPQAAPGRAPTGQHRPGEILWTPEPGVRP